MLVSGDQAFEFLEPVEDDVDLVDSFRFFNHEKSLVVTTQLEPTFAAATPRLLFEGRYTSTSNDWTSNYDVSIDGQQFLMIKEPEKINQIHVILNWFEEHVNLVDFFRFFYFQSIRAG